MEDNDLPSILAPEGGAMSVIAERLSQITPGEPQAHENLTHIPLIGEVGDPFYLLLDEALESGHARVEEISEVGSPADPACTHNLFIPTQPSRRSLRPTSLNPDCICLAKAWS